MNFPAVHGHLTNNFTKYRNSEDVSDDMVQQARRLRQHAPNLLVFQEMDDVNVGLGEQLWAAYQAEVNSNA
jgi:hypothetical protein